MMFLKLVQTLKDYIKAISNILLFSQKKKKWRLGQAKKLGIQALGSSWSIWVTWRGLDINTSPISFEFFTAAK